MKTAPSKFEKIRLDINTYEKQAMEVSTPRALGKGTSASLSREQLTHLVGLLWKLSAAYKDYARLLEQSLVDIRQNMDKDQEKNMVEDTALNLDRLIDALQKIEDVTREYKE